MGKPKFSVEEFVYVPGYRKHICFFYLYDYIRGQTYPYHIMSLEKNNRIYKAKAKDLRSISNVTDLINTILSGSVNMANIIEKGRLLKEERHDPKINRWGTAAMPIDWELNRDIEVRHYD